MRLVHVVGARPNLPKLSPVYRAAHRSGATQIIVHTGQHYDDALSAALIRDLGLPEPDLNLGVGSGTHAEQTARVMLKLEPVLRDAPPDWVVVYGDVNSTVAGALVATKLGLRVAHVEAGLRSGDRSMPEEINRIVTDRLADLLLTPSHDADAVLRAEGEPDDEIVFVGNVMIDSLQFALEVLGPPPRVPDADRPIVVTLHRPSNVDEPSRLSPLAHALAQLADHRPVVFPVHPRAKARLLQLCIDLGAVQLIEPLGYLDMVDLVRGAAAVITDSGGLQEESTVLGIPCFTVRSTTERPITIREGTNCLVPDPADLVATVCRAPPPGPPRAPEGWDGQAGARVVRALLTH